MPAMIGIRVPESEKDGNLLERLKEIGRRTRMSHYGLLEKWIAMEERGEVPEVSGQQLSLNLESSMTTPAATDQEDLRAQIEDLTAQIAILKTTLKATVAEVAELSAIRAIPEYQPEPSAPIGEPAPEIPAQVEEPDTATVAEQPKEPQASSDDTDVDATVAYIIELFEAGLTLRGIADRLNVEAHPLPPGSRSEKWGHTQIDKILIKKGAKERKARE